MNPLAATSLEDVQAQADRRGVPINEVGICDLRYPILVTARAGVQSTVATVHATVALPDDARGTHMSRFVESLSERIGPLDANSCASLAEDLCARLTSAEATVGFRFTYFIKRAAPITGLPGLVDVEATLEATARETTTVRVGVRVPVTSLCPCSREISDYGAHNQRGHVEIAVVCQPGESVTIEDLVDMADDAASAPIYSLLKRVDERSVTMSAYEKPAFVEDIARDVVLALRADHRIAEYSVSVINQESIHNHNAIATIRGRAAA
jgi:GTP cyclohydrolase IB